MCHSKVGFILYVRMLLQFNSRLIPNFTVMVFFFNQLTLSYFWKKSFWKEKNQQHKKNGRRKSRNQVSMGSMGITLGFLKLRKKNQAVKTSNSFPSYALSWVWSAWASPRLNGGEFDPTWKKARIISLDLRVIRILDTDFLRLPYTSIYPFHWNLPGFL